jgi:NitT/TauT family transport system ATP-binding protein
LSRPSPAVELQGAGHTLSLRRLSKTYRSGADLIPAIDEVTLEVSNREFLSIVGPSGCGKTTLLKLVAGLIPPSGGEVLIGSERVTGPIRDFGIVFQKPTLLPWRTVLNNVLLPIEMLKLPRAAHVDRARELLAQAGLRGFEDRRPNELSGGMQQRVALCRALVHDPEILLMDEPFAAVDEFNRERLNDQLLSLWAFAKKTIVFVTHNVVEAVYLSDRVAVLSRRPSRIAGVEDIQLPRPRRADMRFDPQLLAHARNIQRMLREAS